MDVVVTGASGHVGANLVRELLRRGHRVRALVRREDPPARIVSPRAPVYDRSKAAGEAEVRRVIERGLDAVIVHPTGIVGPHDHRGSRMGRLLLALCRRRLPALVDGGFDWVDVRDVAAAAIAAAEKGRTGESYLLPGHWASLAELARLTEACVTTRAPRVVVPVALARLGAPPAEWIGRAFGFEPLFTRESLAALTHYRRIRGDKAASELGHRPRPLADTLRDTLAWFARTGSIRREAVRFDVDSTGCCGPGGSHAAPRAGSVKEAPP